MSRKRGASSFNAFEFLRGGRNGATPGRRARREIKPRHLQFETCEYRSMLNGLPAIGGTKFDDSNGDGDLTGEAPLAGVTIELYRDGGDGGDGVFDPNDDMLVDSQITGIDGTYTFIDLDDDRYFLREVPGAGRTQTFPVGPDFYTLDVSGGNVIVKEAQVIDNFNNPDPAVSYFINALDADPKLIKSLGAGIIGGERDLLIDVQGPANAISASGIIGGIGMPGSGVFAFGSTTPGSRATLQYDGVDDDNPANPDDPLENANLLVVDLTAGGANAIRIKFIDLQIPGVMQQLDFTIDLTSAGGTASLSGAMNESPDPTSFVGKFTDFVPGPGFSFTEVKSIEVILNTTGVSDIDFTIDDITLVREQTTGFDFGNTLLVPGIEIEKFVNELDADSPIGPVLAVGSNANFRYAVVATGGVAVRNVVVVDDNGTPGDTSDDFNPTFTGGDTNGDSTLDVSEVWMYEAVLPVVAGQYTNIATVTGDGGTGGTISDTDPANYFGLLSGINIVKSTNGDDANSPTGPILSPGDTATFTYVVTNTGNGPLADIVVVDDNGTPGDTSDDFNPTFTGGDTSGDTQLDIDETWTYEATRIVTAGQYTNIAEVFGTDQLEGEVSDTDPSNHLGLVSGIDIEKFTNGDDADTPTGPLVDVGDTVTFTYTVTNSGNAPLANIIVVDDNGTPGDESDDFQPTFTGGDTNGDTLLDVTETWTYTAQRVATAGQYTNRGDVVGESLLAELIRDEDFSNHFGVLPAIDIEKLTNGDDADTPTGPQVAVGSTVTFTYIVTNTGNAPLSNVVVNDDNGTPADQTDDFAPTFVGGDDNGDTFLDLTETWTYEALHTVTIGQYRNDATVDGEGPLGEQVFDTDPSHHFGLAPAIDIKKFTNGNDADTATGPLIAVGDTATFTYVVNNTGTFPLNNVVVTDDNGTPGDTGDDFSPTFVGGDDNGDTFLDLTETWTYEALHTVTAGQYTNIGSVVGDAGAAGSANDSDPSNHFGLVGGINIEKATNGQDADSPTGPFIPVGGNAVFTYVVTNTGNGPLADVVVSDDNGTPGNTADDFQPTFTGGDTDGNNQLDVTETWTYTAGQEVTAGQYTNIGSVSGLTALEGAVSDSDPSNHFGAVAGIDIEKSVNGQDADSPPGPNLEVGSTATFTYTVVNNGNSALSNVVVVDDNGTPGNTGDDFNPTFTGGDTDGDNQLDPVETWTFTANRIVTEGQYTNVGRVTANTVLGGQATDSDPANFVGVVTIGSISGFVFVDVNKNNFKEPIELPIQGVRVTLTGFNDLGQNVNILAITAADGSFSFPGLRPGTYSLSEEQPQNYLDAGSATGTGIQFGGNVGNTNLLSNIQLQGGENGVDYRFGELGKIPSIISKRSYLTPMPPKVAPLAAYATGNGTGNGHTEIAAARVTAVPLKVTSTSKRRSSSSKVKQFDVAPPPKVVVSKPAATLRKFNLSSFLKRLR